MLDFYKERLKIKNYALTFEGDSKIQIQILEYEI